MTERRKALLLLDYQVALCEEGPYLRMPPLAAQVAERDVLATASRVLEAARAAGWLVVHVRLAFDPTYTLRTNRLPRFDAYPDQRAMLADSPEAQIVKALAPIDGEPVVDKGCVDPFVGTPLLQVLAAEGIGEVVLGGVGDQPRRRVGRPARQRRRPAGDRGRGHVRLVPARLPRVLGAAHAAAVRHGHHRRRAAGGVGMSALEYDVVVVGGGVAGLSAACSAAEHGARVALLDRATEAESGGNTRYTEAFLRMRSLEETADGLEDTLVDDFMGHPDPSVVGDAVRAPGQRSPLYRASHVIDPEYVGRARGAGAGDAGLDGRARAALRLPAHAVPDHLDHPDGAGRRRPGDRRDDGQGRARPGRRVPLRDDGPVAGGVRRRGRRRLRADAVRAGGVPRPRRPGVRGLPGQRRDDGALLRCRTA